MSVFINECLELFPKEKPQVNDLLIASPLVQQDIFYRSVLLICEHDDKEGSFALVLNKPIKFKLTELNSDIIHWDSHLYQGGPVQKNALNYVYRNLQLENSTVLSDNICWGGDFEELDDMLSVIDKNQVDIKFFIGYSGWSAYQLDYELKKKSWLLLRDYPEDFIFDDCESLWENCLERLGSKHQILKNYPTDLSLN